jgi:protein-S-isoprenylcysteine O-methyltransferase Ste14
MPLIEEFKLWGEALFRRRSYVPLLFFAVVAAAMPNFDYPFQSHAWDLAWDILCLTVGFLGLAVRVMTVAFVPKDTSGRGTVSPSAGSLNTTGLYSVTRNPLYLGNFLLYLAPALFIRNPWVVIIFVLAFTVYYERIIFAEEAFLREKFGRDYLEWASGTPAFIPNFSLWRKTMDRPFSWKMALSREYHGLYGLVVTLSALEFIADCLLHKTVVVDMAWISVFIAGTAFYLTVRFLVKRTTMLKV